MEGRWILLGVIIAAGVLFAFIAKMFVVPLIVALTIVNLFSPLYGRLYRLFKERAVPAALVITLVIFIVLMVPVYFVSQMLVIQAIDVYTFLSSWLKDPGIESVLNKVQGWSTALGIDIERIDWQGIAGDSLSQLTSFTSTIINRTSAGVLSFLFNLFVVLFSIFYFFKDGDRLLSGIKNTVPMENEHIDRIVLEFKRTSRAAVSATVVIGLIQGTVGAVSFVIVGIQAWALWGVIMTVLSIIPLVGSYFVMAPAAVYLFTIGRPGAGVFIIIMATLVSYGVDYLLRPALVGKDAKMHDLLVFVSSIGGIAVFGITGFIVGPVLASILVALMRLYRSGMFPSTGSDSGAERDE